MALALPITATGSEDVLIQADDQLIKQGRALVETANKKGLPAEVKRGIQHAASLKGAARQTAEQSRQQAEQWVRTLQKAQAVRQANLERARTEREAASKAPRILIFASRSLGEKGLEELFSTAATTPHATVIFRGIPKNMPLSRGILAMQALAAYKKPTPTLLIDPTLFRRYQVTTVPTIMMLEGAADEASPIKRKSMGKQVNMLARVSGLADPAWLIRKVGQGVRGDQGLRGPVRAISEPDLIEVMKARVTAINWKAKKEQAKARFWQQQRFIELPQATRSRRRVIDPTVTVTQDIRAADGTIITQRGAQINPFDLRPFTQAVVVFDPLDKEQMAWLAKTVPHLKKRPGVQQLTFIATRFGREHGWDLYRRTLDAVDAPVYLLTPDVVERFALAVTPSVITAQGKHFVVEERSLPPISKADMDAQ